MSDTKKDVLETENMDAETDAGMEEKTTDAVPQDNTEVSEEPAYEKTELTDPIYEVDVHIKASDLFDYSLRHSYTSLSGLLSTIIGFLMIYAYFAKGASVWYLLFGIIVVVYIPANLFLMSRQQAMQETFQKPLRYTFYKEGMAVSQGDAQEVIGWDYILKAVATSNSIIVYTGKNRASIFPRRDLNPDATALIQVLSTHLDPKKIKIKQ